MQQKTIEAKSKGNVVATATIDVPDTLQEAVSLFGGEEKVLALANQQYVIKELNRIRNEATQGIKIPKILRDRLLELPAEKRAECAALLGIPAEALEALVQ